MIKGIGVDIVEIERIKAAVLKHESFVSKVYSEEEIIYIKSRGYRAETMAGLYAAKEAVSKALGTGFVSFSLRDIIILKDDKNKPYVKLLGNALNLAEQYGNFNIELSISHSRENAIAYVIWEALI